MSVSARPLKMAESARIPHSLSGLTRLKSEVFQCCLNYNWELPRCQRKGGWFATSASDAQDARTVRRPRRWMVGLSTALELKSRRPDAHVITAAKHLPGDRSIDYCSSWAGANWMSTAIDNGVQEEWDAETYRRFGVLADTVPEASITRMDPNVLFDRPMEQAEVLSQATGKIWYDALTGGICDISKDKLPEDACFGMVISTFMVNTQGYLGWYVFPPYRRCTLSHILF